MNSMKNYLFFIIVMLLNLAAYSQSPDKFNYQAVIRDISGNAIINKNVSIRISILQGGEEGTLIFSEAHSVISSQFGLINLVIGDGIASFGNIEGINWMNGPHYIKLELDSEGGSDYKLMGISQILSVPFSLNSRSTLQVTGSETWDKDYNNDVTITGNQIIEGNKTFNDQLIVNNSLKTIVSNSSNAISGENTNMQKGGSGFAVYGKHSNNAGIAIKGLSPHIGIMGESTSASGTDYGVYGSSKSSDGSGLFGINDSPTGKGVEGFASDSNGINYGVYGRTSSRIGKAVYGVATNSIGTNAGVVGISESHAGYGVYAFNNALDGSSIAIYGGSFSPGAKAVYGHAKSETGLNYGVYGISSSSSGYGVYGINSSETGSSAGVYGTSISSFGVGVYGLAYSEYGTSYGIMGNSKSIDGYDFYATGKGVNYGAPSSSRWKTDVIPMTDILSKIKNLEGVYFSWDSVHGGQHDLGFIGEEIAKYFPEVVAKDPASPGYVTGMDYSKMTPVLLQAINEQQVIIENQQRQIDDLLKRIEALETK